MNMKITEQTPIHFFVGDKSNLNWNDIRLESFLEIPNNGKVRFKAIESIHLFAHTSIEETEVCSYQVSFGRNDCTYSGHDSLKSLIEKMQSNFPIYGFKNVSKEEYLIFRAKTFKLLNQHPFANYENLEVNCDLKL